MDYSRSHVVTSIEYFGNFANCFFDKVAKEHNKVKQREKEENKARKKKKLVVAT